jgi:methylmalonyl-CoA mutase
MTDRTPLLAEFDRPTLAQWQAEVERLLRGAPFAKKMFTRTLEGLTVGSMATAADLPDTGWAATGPGQSPWLRGADRDNSWLVAQEIPAAGATEFNRALRHDLERGQDAVNLVLEGAGPRGVRIAHAADLGAALAGVDLTATPVLIQSGAEHLRLAEDLLALCSDLGQDASALVGRIGCDPVAGRATEGELPVPAAELYDQLAALSRRLADQAPGLRTVPVFEDPWHDGGADGALSLALTLAAAVGALREMESRNLQLENAAKQVHFNLCIGSDFFLEISRLRALRVLWARVLEACGVDPTVAPPVIHARTSRRTGTVLDPHVNMLRATTQAMSAVLGGVESLHVAPFDETTAPADEFSRRIARNVQLILRHECHLDHVVDPAGGSWFVEKLTAEVAARTWERFQQIEKAGGVMAALDTGVAQRWVADAADARAARMATRDEVQVGTNQYPDPNPLPSVSGRAEVPAGAIPLRRESEPFEALRSRVEKMAGTPAGRVFCANLGDVAKYMPRLEFTRRFFRTGGFEVSEDGFATSADQAVAAARRDGAGAVVLVGRDDTYADLAAAVASGLKEGADPPVVLLAGAAPAGADLDETIGIKSNVLEVLGRLADRVGGAS